MASPEAGESRRNVPVALLYVGLPAYFALTVIAIRDIAHAHTTPVAAVASGTIGLFTLILLWLAFVTPPPGSERQTVWLVMILVALAIGLAPLGGPAVTYLLAASAMAADALKPSFSVPVVAVVFVVVTANEAALGFSFQNILRDAVFALVLPLFVFGIRRLSDTNRELVAARDELARLAVVSERLRFARDLHDLLGHSLTVIRAKSELAARLTPADSAPAREMAEVEALARKALAEVREAVVGYRHTSLADEMANAQAALGAAGIAADVTDCPMELPASIDETLGWVVREAVTNVVRHSGAAHCHVATAPNEGGIRLEVTDDGRGAPTATGTGLASMRERVSALGGTLDLQQSPGGGLRLVAFVPRGP